MTNIALVDDEVNILTSVSIALEIEGFNVDTFTNGEEAIRGLENKKYARAYVHNIMDEGISRPKLERYIRSSMISLKRLRQNGFIPSSIYTGF